MRWLCAGTPTSTRPRCWSPSTAEFVAHYGKAGTGQETFAVPYPLRLDWDLQTTVHEITTHGKARESALAALEEIRATYGLAEIRRLGLDRYGGGFYDRNKRGGTTKSAHAFAALDWFPSANGLRETKRTARFARPEYRPFLDAWERAGWMSLGRCFDYDWMHVQRNPQP